MRKFKLKNRVEITKGNDMIKFFLIHKTGRYYLYQQKFSKAVYEFFRNGRSLSELRQFRFSNNKRLNKTVSETLPLYIHYVLRYEVPASDQVA